MVKIAVDMMGSDSGPETLAQSVMHYLKDNKDVFFLLFGDEETLNNLFKECPDKDRIEIHGTKTIIPMEIKPLDFLRAKTSSMYQAVNAVKEGLADGVLTAGSTGGFVTGSTILLRTVDGVLRAGLCSPFPTRQAGHPTVILDIGANNYDTEEEVYQFGIMGRLYSKHVLDTKDPSVYILSNGAEEGKGTDEVVGAYRLMRERNLPGFKGNVEAREALDGTHDVIVTPGYAGNIFLKTCEGVSKMMNDLIKESFKMNLLTKIGYLFSSKGFKKMKTTLDYRRYGGAILLGINGVCVKAHGNSNEYAFYHAIGVCKKMIDVKIVDKIKEEFANSTETND
ncbi:MAG: phosphate acyltransferase PlsX [Bacilli bacterium]|nr:phosphate acyltransferase PlsX [Bacilli bacterium]